MMRFKDQRELVAAVLEVLEPLAEWSHQCHAASVRIVKAGIFEQARVARGVCPGLGSQHSWVVLGDDCYARDVVLVDPTLWSYDPTVEGIWIGDPADRGHTPHGAASIWAWGKPPAATDEPVELTEPEGGWSDDAKLFLELLGPLDVKGWRTLCQAPVEKWPAGEVFGAICDTFDWGEAVIPIDILGMVTDRNPGGLYLPGEEVTV